MIESLIFELSLPLLVMSEKERLDWYEDPKKYIYSQNNRFNDITTAR